LDQKSDSSPGAELAVSDDLPPWGQLKPIALSNSTPSGCAEITHPFHPLHGKSFPILKSRFVAGIETLILQDSSRGTFAVPKEWTDRADPSPHNSLHNQASLFAAHCLLALVALVQELEHHKDVDKL
jgi:hypothetical protein